MIKVGEENPFFGGEDISIRILNRLLTTHQLTSNSLPNLTQKVKLNYGFITKYVHYTAVFYYRPP
jgi:hypothetical protein